MTKIFGSDGMNATSWRALGMLPRRSRPALAAAPDYASGSTLPGGHGYPQGTVWGGREGRGGVNSRSIAICFSFTTDFVKASFI